MSRNTKVTIEMVEGGFTVERSFPIARTAVAVDMNEAHRVTEMYFDSGPEDMATYEKAEREQTDE